MVAVVAPFTSSVLPVATVFPSAVSCIIQCAVSPPFTPSCSTFFTVAVRVFFFTLTVFSKGQS